MSDKLIPPDKKRCQAEIIVTPGARAAVVEGLESHGQFGAFMLGPQASQRQYRCEYVPVVIAKEKRAINGQRGSMSLCEMHRIRMIEQCGEDFATFTPIKRKRSR